jgi:hypothetical protein
VQLENIIVNEKGQYSDAEKVHGTHLRWMRTFCKMGIITRHSDKKIINKLAVRGNTVMFVGYSNIHEKDVYQFMTIETKKTMFSRDVIFQNTT